MRDQVAWRLLLPTQSGGIKRDIIAVELLVHASQGGWFLAYTSINRCSYCKRMPIPWRPSTRIRPCAAMQRLEVNPMLPGYLPYASVPLYQKRAKSKREKKSKYEKKGGYADAVKAREVPCHNTATIKPKRGTMHKRSKTPSPLGSQLTNYPSA